MVAELQPPSYPGSGLLNLLGCGLKLSKRDPDLVPLYRKGSGWDPNLERSRQNTADYSQIEVETPPTTFTVGFDTGSADVWLPGSRCTSSACLAHSRYNPRLSTTAQFAQADSRNASIYVFYGTREVRLAPVNDTLRVGNISIEQQGIGVAGSLSPGYADTSYDGLLGLGFPTNSALKAVPPFFSMIQQGLLEQPMFSVWLNPHLTAADAGEVAFGGINPNRFSTNMTT
ncbi:hypothetical protein WJX84_000230 [Apatococcus fuscideae]